MFAKIKSIFVIPELRQKVLITLLFLAVYRIGYAIPLPFIDQRKMGYSRATTALGNVLVQALGLRLLGSLAQGREAVRRSVEVQTYTPRNPQAWQEPYQRFLALLKR